MSAIFEPTIAASTSDRIGRGPAIVLAVVVAFGILADRFYPMTLDRWLLFVALMACASILLAVARTRLVCPSNLTDALVSRPRLANGATRWVSVGLLLAGWFGLAGAWHHWRWGCRAADDIANSATDEPQLVCVVGKAIQSPWVIRNAEPNTAPWRSPERSILILKCQSLETNGVDALCVSGYARVSMDGVLSSVVLGDIVKIYGELVLPSTPSNPGDIDQKSYLRSQGISALVRSKSVEGITVLKSDRTIWNWFLILRGKIRDRAERLISSSLGPDTAPVAQAMLLGSRVQIDEDTRRAFRESGMLHILAISGMNVGFIVELVMVA